MAGLSERITVVIDVVTDRARSGLKSFRSDVTQAEGAMGKVQAGAKNLGTQFSQYLGPAALAAGSALVAFGVKSVQAFQETALAAGKFSDATGIAVEDASRWIEVAGDIGISAEQMEGSFAKLNRALGQGDLKQWGIDANNATDGFLQTVEALRRIEDPTQRALLAQQAFGKGYTQIAELTAMSAQDLRKALDGVSEAKTIDREEVRKAREMRAAMDDLNDKFEDVQLMIGEKLVPVVTDLAESLDALDTSFELPGLKESTSFLDGFVNGITSLGNPTEAFRKTLEDLDPLAPRITGKLGDIAGAAEVLAGKEEKAVEVTEDWLDPLSQLEQSLLDAADAMEKVWDKIPQAFDAEEAFLQLKVAADNYFASLVSGEKSAEELRLEEINLAKQAWAAAEAIAAQAGAQDGSTLKAQIMRDELMKLANQFPGLREEIKLYVAELKKIPPSVSTTITATKAGSGKFVGSSGGIVTQPTMALIGESGPEAVVPLSRAPGASPLGGTAAGAATFNINVTAGWGANGTEIGQAIYEELVKLQRRNGALIGLRTS